MSAHCHIQTLPATHRAQLLQRTRRRPSPPDLCHKPLQTATNHTYTDMPSSYTRASMLPLSRAFAQPKTTPAPNPANCLPQSSNLRAELVLGGTFGCGPWLRQRSDAEAVLPRGVDVVRLELCVP